MNFSGYYLLSGIKAYHCHGCDEQSMCVGHFGPADVKIRDQMTLNLQNGYPSSLEINDPNVGKFMRYWCLNCGVELLSNNKTPCGVYFCPNCKTVCTIVMSETYE